MTELKYALIKIGALLSYCGGPLILTDMLKLRIGTPLAIALTFAPIVLMIFGVESLFDPSPRRRERIRSVPSQQGPVPEEGVRWAVLFVRLGLAGALVTLLLHAYGAWSLATMPARPDHGLYVFGIIVGIPLAGWYAYSARRWLSGAGAPEDPFSPIEPT
ncbi:MAG: hypothetical protein ACREOU_09730 [Candidatus Eiseniibacteriota bacterium]